MAPIAQRIRPVVAAAAGVGVLVVLGLVVVAPRWQEVVASGWTTRPGRALAVALAVVVANALANALQAECWHGLVSGTTVPAPTRRVTYRAQALALPVRYAAPGGHVAARAALTRRAGTTLPTGVGLGIVELLGGVAVLSLAALATLPVWTALPAAQPLAWIAIGPALMALALLASPTRVMSVATRLLGSVGRRRLPRPPSASDRVVRAFLGRYLAAVLIRGTAFVGLALHLVGVTDGDSVLQTSSAALGAFAVGNLVGRLIVAAPAGLGARDATITAVLAPAAGLGPAGLVAVVARFLDALGELLFIATVLLLTSRSTITLLEEGEVIVLPDGHTATVGPVDARVWSRVGPATTQDGAALFVKQHLNGRGRPDPRASRLQATATARAGDLGLPVVASLCHDGQRALTIAPLVQLRPIPEEEVLAAAVWLAGLLEGPASPIPVFGVDAIEMGQDGVVLVDLPDTTGRREEWAAAMTASALAGRWGRPLTQFWRGPDWTLADQLRVVLAADPVLVEEDWTRQWRRRRREMVGRGPAEAIGRALIVNTLGWRYHRKVVRGLRDWAVPAERATPTPRARAGLV